MASSIAPAYTALLTELVAFGTRRFPRVRQRWPAHLHSYYQLDVTFAGSATLTLDGGRRIAYRRGAVVLSPPMVRHHHDTLGGFEVGMFKFRAGAPYWALLGRLPRIGRLPADVLRSVKTSAEALRLQAPLAINLVEGALISCLSHLVGLQPTAGAAPLRDDFEDRLYRLLERIENEPFADRMVSRLAAQCRMTADHFTRRFREALDQTPQEYLARVRMRAAASALTGEPRLPIKEVAARAGYSSVHAFSRIFSKTFGVAPGAYARNRPEL